MSGSVLHLRYCACVLRVADILEFDPERTPDILFAHRGVGKGSAIFWHKDHQLGFALKDGQVSIQARPPDALTHHAIDLTIRAVDRELQLCRQLADETHFNQMLGRDDLPHRWTLETKVVQDVEPLDGAYEYIDGTFRPDASRLLELVGGVELYGSPLAAVRELLQNAFDAVREQIARQRLRQEDPASPEVGDLIARTHSVSLTLEQSADGVRLICRDTGCGMSRDIIRSRFLIGGKKANHDMRALERTCHEHGFTTGKTARFGIGVLSYFLIATKMTTRTRRSIEGDDLDGTGWSFTSEGLEDFGELRPARGAQVGTEVELMIKPDLLGDDPTAFATDIRSYIAAVVRRVPCRFTFSAPDFGVPKFFSDLGWADRSQTATELFTHAITEVSDRSVQTPKELLSHDAQQSRNRQSEYWKAVRLAAQEALVVNTYCASLPDQLGVFRISFGCFDIENHSLAAFLKPNGVDGAAMQFEKIEGIDGLGPSGSAFMSWNGMRLEIDAEDFEFRWLFRIPNMIVEIDWCNDSAGRLAVDRNRFEASAAARRALGTVHEAVDRLGSDFLKGNLASPFCLLNARVLNVEPTPETKPMWLAPTGGDHSMQTLEGLHAPLIDNYVLFDFSGLKWRGDVVNTAKSTAMSVGEYHREMQWHGGGQSSPTSIGLMTWQDSFFLIPVWEDISFDSEGEPMGPLASFPPEFNGLVSASMGGGARGHGMTVLNSVHPLVKACDTAAWNWAMDTFVESRDPLPHRDEMMESAARVSAWILLCLRFGEQEIWEGLKDRSKDFLGEAWGTVEGLADGDEILQWKEHSLKEQSLVSLTPLGWKSIRKKSGDMWYSGRIAPPSAEWWLTYKDGSREICSPLDW